MIFTKVKFADLTEKQQLVVMRAMINHYTQSNAYLTKTVDDEWWFEVIDKSYQWFDRHKDKAIAFNKADMERKKNYIATK